MRGIDHGRALRGRDGGAAILLVDAHDRAVEVLEVEGEAVVGREVAARDLLDEVAIDLDRAVVGVHVDREGGVVGVAVPIRGGRDGTVALVFDHDRERVDRRREARGVNGAVIGDAIYRLLRERIARRVRDLINFVIILVLRARAGGIRRVEDRLEGNGASQRADLRRLGVGGGDGVARHRHGGSCDLSRVGRVGHVLAARGLDLEVELVVRRPCAALELLHDVDLDAAGAGVLVGVRHGERVGLLGREEAARRGLKHAVVIGIVVCVVLRQVREGVGGAVRRARDVEGVDREDVLRAVDLLPPCVGRPGRRALGAGDEDLGRGFGAGRAVELEGRAGHGAVDPGLGHGDIRLGKRRIGDRHGGNRVVRARAGQIGRSEARAIQARRLIARKRVAHGIDRLAVACELGLCHAIAYLRAVRVDGQVRPGHDRGAVRRVLRHVRGLGQPRLAGDALHRAVEEDGRVAAARGVVAIVPILDNGDGDRLGRVGVRDRERGRRALGEGHAVGLADRLGVVVDRVLVERVDDALAAVVHGQTSLGHAPSGAGSAAQRDLFGRARAVGGAKDVSRLAACRGLERERHARRAQAILVVRVVPVLRELERRRL